jgi:hypothetical protein
MTTEIVASAIVIVAVAFALADLFWPITVSVAFGVALAWWFGRLVYLHAWLRPWMFPAYVFVGFAWVFFKWTRIVEASLREDKRIRYEHCRTGPPKWSQHSYDFAAYFFYWPLDVVAYMLSDFLVSLWRGISAMVSGSFDRYAEWRFKEARSRRRSEE